MSSPARLLVLRALLAAPSATRADVAAAGNLAARSAWGALRELEELGYVTVEGREVTGRGANHRYSVDRQRLDDDLEALVRWVLDPR